MAGSLAGTFGPMWAEQGGGSLTAQERRSLKKQARGTRGDSNEVLLVPASRQTGSGILNTPRSPQEITAIVAFLCFSFFFWLK